MTVKTHYKGCKHFHDNEIIHYDQSTNTVHLKEGVKRRNYRTNDELLDLWFGTNNPNINEEALFYDKVIKARKVIDEDKYWINDELECN